MSPRTAVLSLVVAFVGLVGTVAATSDYGLFLAAGVRAQPAQNLVLYDANGGAQIYVGTSGTTLGHTYWQDNTIPRWGTGQDATIQWRTYDTNDSLNFTTGPTSYGGSGSANASAYFQFVPRAAAGGTESYDHPAGSHPTLAVHSTLDPTTDHSECSEWSYTGLLGGNAQSSYRMETDRAAPDFTVRAAGAKSGAATNTAGADLTLSAGSGSGTGVGGGLTLSGGDGNTSGTVTTAGRLVAQYLDASVALVDSSGNSYGSLLSEMGEISQQGNASATVITNTSDFFLVNFSGTTLETAHGFDSPVSGRLRYTGTSTRHFHVACTLSAVPANANRTLYFRVAINGTTMPASEVRQRHSTSTDEQSTAIHVIAHMSQNDYLELYVRNVTGADNATVSCANVFALGVPCDGLCD